MLMAIYVAGGVSEGFGEFPSSWGEEESGLALVTISGNVPTCISAAIVYNEA